jgi:hypothetical protein
MKKLLNSFLVGLILISCSSDNQEEKTKKEYKFEAIGDQKIFKAPLKELSDEDYPDNPDMMIRSELDGQYSRSEVEFRMKDSEWVYDVVFLPNNERADTVILENVNLEEFIPTIPEHVKQDDYLTLIGLINQEWNRQQVKFPSGQFLVKGVHGEDTITDRVDLARNCLNTGLWEFIMYTKEDDKQKPYYHAWFDFPKDLYAHLFFKRNNLELKNYAHHLVDWIDPDSEEIKFDLLRTVSSTKELQHEFKPEEFYPLVGERKKKQKNIVTPKEHNSIGDFLNDHTTFATFSIPGFYNTKDPRKTELGRFQKLDKVELSEIVSTNPNKTNTQELKLVFSDDQGRVTQFYIGGFNFNEMPILPIAQAHKGLQMPMGIANHTFYTTYENTLKSPSKESAFYALIVDENNHFLDSHFVGIDGPLFHRDANYPNILHMWVLSFERHAFVGHYVITLSEEELPMI